MNYTTLTMISLIFSIVLLSLSIKRSTEPFGWSCTFTPSEFPPEKVDMGTVRDRLATRGDFI